MGGGFPVCEGLRERVTGQILEGRCLQRPGSRERFPSKATGGSLCYPGGAMQSSQRRQNVGEPSRFARLRRGAKRGRFAYSLRIDVQICPPHYDSY